MGAAEALHDRPSVERYPLSPLSTTSPSLFNRPFLLLQNQKQARNTAARAGVEFYGPDRAL
jgi:hypothetical protein